MKSVLLWKCTAKESLPSEAHPAQEMMETLTNGSTIYSPAGGTIVLRSQIEQDAIQISIQDQGIGIAEEAQNAIFAPYSRIESEKTRYIAGTGLGLSVVQEIVRLHGGTIWVESTVGHGSTFSVSLPISEKTPQHIPLKG